MKKEKITGDMDIKEMIKTMAEGNFGAAFTIKEMLNYPSGILDILLCDTLEIRGAKLYMLYNDCCGRNCGKLKRTLNMFHCGIFSKEEIQANLSLARAIPFIDDGIVIDSIPPYSVDFGFGDEKWEEFCAQNKESFKAKLNKILEEIAPAGR